MSRAGYGTRGTFVVGRMDRRTRDVRIVPEWAPLRGPWKIRAVVTAVDVDGPRTSGSTREPVEVRRSTRA